MFVYNLLHFCRLLYPNLTLSLYRDFGQLCITLQILLILIHIFCQYTRRLTSAQMGCYTLFEKRDDCNYQILALTITKYYRQPFFHQSMLWFDANLQSFLSFASFFNFYVFIGTASYTALITCFIYSSFCLPLQFYSLHFIVFLN